MGGADVYGPEAAQQDLARRRAFGLAELLDVVADADLHVGGLAGLAVAGG